MINVSSFIQHSHFKLNVCLICPLRVGVGHQRMRLHSITYIFKINNNLSIYRGSDLSSYYIAYTY